MVIMLGLSMVVIAGMVGTGGLGGAVNEAIGQVDIGFGFGFEAGVGTAPPPWSSPSRRT
ncbi:hypothetical protein [Streptomyces arenae]|uniref:hypothetical protein n=1 Tax=Streptomyces arenae TaxID=29301 RepID=UPI003D2D8A20